MASAQVVETSVANNSPSQDSNHPDDLFQSKFCLYRIVRYSSGDLVTMPVRQQSINPASASVDVKLLLSFLVRHRGS